MGRTNVIRDYGGVSASDRRDERRRKLLKAGREVWGQSGIGEVTVRGVCGQAGLIPRYFYEQFADRDALLLVVGEQVRDELIATLLSVGLNEPGDVADKLRAALKALLDLIAADPLIHRIVADVVIGAGPLAGPRRQALDIITDLILQYGPGFLDFESPDPAETRRIASFIVGGVNQLIDAWVLDPRESTAELATACAELSLSVVRSTSL
jgi:AcrR family transcriptional regulator